MSKTNMKIPAQLISPMVSFIQGRKNRLTSECLVSTTENIYGIRPRLLSLLYLCLATTCIWVVGTIMGVGAFPIQQLYGQEENVSPVRGTMNGPLQTGNIHPALKIREAQYYDDSVSNVITLF